MRAADCAVQPSSPKTKMNETTRGQFCKQTCWLRISIEILTKVSITGDHYRTVILPLLEIQVARVGIVITCIFRLEEGTAGQGVYTANGYNSSLHGRGRKAF